jgi:hypothetical protein
VLGPRRASWPGQATSVENACSPLLDATRAHGSTPRIPVSWLWTAHMTSRGTFQVSSSGLLRDTTVRMQPGRRPASLPGATRSGDVRCLIRDTRHSVHDRCRMKRALTVSCLVNALLIVVVGVIVVAGYHMQQRLDIVAEQAAQPGPVGPEGPRGPVGATGFEALRVKMDGMASTVTTVTTVQTAEPAPMGQRRGGCWS